MSNSTINNQATLSINNSESALEGVTMETQQTQDNLSGSFLDAGMKKEDSGFSFPDISISSILKTTAITVAGGYALYTLKSINEKLDMPKDPSQ